MVQKLFKEDKQVSTSYQLDNLEEKLKIKILQKKARR